MFEKLAKPASIPIKPRYEIEFEDFDDSFNPRSGWITLLYGASGSGKTWLAGTADRSLYLNTGGGIDTLRSPLFKIKYPNIKRKLVNIYETFDQGTIKKAIGFDKVTDTIDMFLEDADLRDFVRTIIIDDATALRSFAKLRAVEIFDDQRGLSGTSRRQLNRFIQQEPDDVFRQMSMIDWFCQQYIPIFRAEGINFLLTAHERQTYGKAVKKMDERPLKSVRPGFSGQTFPDEIPKHFDEVWYISAKYDDKRGSYSQIKTGGGGLELTKTRRAGVFAHFEVNKSYEQLYQRRTENKLHPSFKSQVEET